MVVHADKEANHDGKSDQRGDRFFGKGRLFQICNADRPGPQTLLQAIGKKLGGSARFCAFGRRVGDPDIYFGAAFTGSRPSNVFPDIRFRRFCLLGLLSHFYSRKMVSPSRVDLQSEQIPCMD